MSTAEKREGVFDTVLAMVYINEGDSIAIVYLAQLHLHTSEHENSVSLSASYGVHLTYYKGLPSMPGNLRDIASFTATLSLDISKIMYRDHEQYESFTPMVVTTQRQI